MGRENQPSGTASRGINRALKVCERGRLPVTGPVEWFFFWFSYFFGGGRSQDGDDLSTS